MESDNSKSSHDDIRQALLRYNARFPLPVNFIADTMLEINRKAERRAYIRGIVTISIVALLMIAVAAALFRMFGIKFAMSVPVTELTSITTTISNSISVVENIISSPITIMLIIASAILLSLDHLVRRHYATHHS